MEGERIVSTSKEGLPEIQRTRSLHGRTSGPTRRSTKGQWTAEEDEILRQAVERFKGKNWKKIAECFKDRTDVQCLHRWQKVLNPELVKGPWSKEEDEIIIQLVNKYGPKKWSTIARHLPGRIGKQCRERWHNHLNPGINKEAWTQEEELALIRAHQIYGNRWAELTKFLPGRTDNAIKNHWNSSVKKKLDSYIASGLLSQFPALPPVGHQYQFAVSSSSRAQPTEDDAGPYSGIETEEISECSQGSTAVGCSQSASDAGATILYKSEGIQFHEEGSFGREQNSDPTCCSEQYFSLKDGDIPMSSVHSAICCSSDLANQRFSCEDEVSARTEYCVNSENLPNISLLELGAGSSDLVTDSVGADDSNEGPSAVPNESSLDLEINLLCSTLGISADQLQQILGSDSEFMLFSEVMEGLSFSTESSREESKEMRFGGRIDRSLGEASNAQMSEIGKASSLAAQHHDNLSILGFSGTSCGQLSKAISPSSLKRNKENGIADHSFDSQHQLVTKGHDSYIYMNDSNDSSCVNETSMGLPEKLDLPKDCSRLVPVNSFYMKSDAAEASSPMEQPVKMEIQDTGSLCYDPPRFPSLDVPFFSCDLVQSDNDTQQEYSPLGIRQLMMPPVGCISPFRLWDSPSQDKSPDAVLKSAAKTFTNTPSILKKRNRELLSPLSDRRIDKKLGTDIASNLSRDFSRLDVMLDDSHKISLQSPQSNLKKNSGNFATEKENLLISQARNQEKEKKHALADERHLDECYDASNCDAKVNKGMLDIKSESKFGQAAGASHRAQPNSLALTEHDINDLLLFSPDQTKKNADIGLNDKTPRREPIKITASVNHNVTIESSSGNSILPECSPAVMKTSHKIHKVADLSTLRVPPALVDNASTDSTHEKSNLFSRTPFKNIESPSAWKSPCFINPFNYEDIRFFMSPGGFGFDAIELAKQTHEHSAAAFADAEEVLGIESPQNVLKEKSLDVGKSDQENHIMKEQMGCRLDFNDCETPEKLKEVVKTATARSFSSPSAYLLKGCR